MNCNDVTTEVVCFTPAVGPPVALTAHYEYRVGTGGATRLHATRFTDAYGVLIDTAGGTVSVGACALPQPDVEYLRQCDVTGVAPNQVFTPFIRQVVFSVDGLGVESRVVTDLALDFVTPHAVAGTVTGECTAPCAPLAFRGIRTNWLEAVQ